MAGNYSGALVRTYATANDVRTPYPDKRHQVDPWTHDDDGSDPYPDTHRVPGDQGSDFDGSDFPTDVVVGGGLVLDQPVFDHDGPAALYPIYTDDQGQQALSAHAGGPDRGYVRSKYSPPDVQGQLEVYGEDITAGPSPLLGPNTEGSPALLRGINSYAMNNPEREGYVQGVRPGIQRLFVLQRERLQHRHRTYDLQPLAERDQLVPVNTPAPGNGRPPMYGPVLPHWLQPGAYHRETRPAFWRNPGTVDDSIMATEPGPDSSVIGGEL